MASYISSTEILPCFKHMNYVGSYIWKLDSDEENTEEIYSKLKNYINEGNVDIEAVLHAIDNISVSCPKHIEKFANIYMKFIIEYGNIRKPNNCNLTAIMISKGVYPEDDRYKKLGTAEDIINIYKKDTVFYYVAWDKIDDLIGCASSNSFDFNQRDNDISLLNCACKYGSEQCYKFIRLNTKEDAQSEYVLSGGNSFIITNEYNNFNLKFYSHSLSFAISFHRNNIADWLLDIVPNIISKDYVPECMHFCNFEAASFFIQHESFDVNYFSYLPYLPVHHSLIM